MSFIQIPSLILSSPPLLHSDALLTTPIAVLVADFPDLQLVLDGYGLDACCGGHLTVEEAARERGLDPATVVHTLSKSALVRGA